MSAAVTASSETGDLLEPGIGQRFSWTVADSVTIARRNLMVWRRVPAYIMFTVVQPVMFTLLFRYVFGGAIHVPIPGGYVGYLMPGIIGQTAAFGSMGTAISLAAELRKGGIDRIRSMPTARSAFLLGRLGADLVRITVTIAVIIGVGYLVGFRFMNGVGMAFGMVALAALFGLCVCCVSAFIGLAIKDEESVQAFGLIWLFPLTFVSSAFVPISSMPGWLQAFALHQPVTQVIDAMRLMALGPAAAPAVGQSLGSALWQSMAWLVGIFLVFAPLAVRAYRRA